MARLRYNGLTATLGADLLTADTTITFAATLTSAAGAVPTITGSDYIPLAVLDTDGGVLEIIHLTAYTGGATTGTVARAQESTTAADHAAGLTVVHGITVADTTEFASSATGEPFAFVLDVTTATGEAAASPLTIPTGVLSGEVTHPAVYFNPDGWNGWEYWLAITPFGGAGTEADENPHVYVSHDGDTWQAPAGLTNPIAPQPGGAGVINSDTHIVERDGTLYVFYRETDDATYDEILVKSSTDGVTWSAASTVLTAGYGAALSPSVFWDGSQWVCYSVNAPTGASVNNTLERRTADNLTGAWSAPTTCTGPSFPSGFELWHAFVARVGGRYYALFDSAPVGAWGASGADLYLAASTDGIAWTQGTDPVIARGGWSADTMYRSCFVPEHRDGRAGLAVWYSGVAADVWKIGRTFVSAPATDAGGGTGGDAPAALVWNNAAQSVPNATLTAITHNSESFDTDGFHDTATNNSRLTIPTGLDGKYLITAGLRFNANATGVRTCTIRKNGSTDLANRVTQAISGWDTNMEATIVADLVAGDYVELVAYQTSGGALSTSPGATYTTLALARLGS